MKAIEQYFRVVLFVVAILQNKIQFFPHKFELSTLGSERVKTVLVFILGPVHTNVFAQERLLSWFSFEETHTFRCVFAYRPHYNDRKSFSSKTLTFESAV